MSFPIVHFRDPTDSLDEVRNKGWYDGVTVECEDGSLYPVVFYVPVRLAQDLQTQLEGVEVGWGKPFIADPRLIILSEITEANIRTSIEQLCSYGWFRKF